MSVPPARLTPGPDARAAERLLALGLLGVALVVMAAGTLLVRVADALVPSTEIGAITDQDHPDPPPPEPGEPTPELPSLTGVQDVLVVGLDSREGLTADQLLALGTEDVGSRLTDTVIWVQVDADQDRVRMVSFPRDLAVTPGGGPRVKLNSLHYYGGPDLLVETVEGLVGADLEHYVEVDLAGFIQLADTLDGVQVCLDERMVDVYAGVNLPAGCHELSATQATGFVRARGVEDRFGSGTAGRAARQQYFIRQAVSEALSSATFTNPSRVGALVSMARSSVVVDEGFSTRELLQFASAFRTLDTDGVAGATVPFDSRRLEDGLFYDVLDAGADELFEALRSGAELPAELVTAEEAATS